MSEVEEAGYDLIGVQNDGEPAVSEPIVEPETPIEEPKAEVEPEPEENEDSEDDDKPRKKTGSQRAREALQREREARIALETELRLMRERTEPKPEPVMGDGEPNEDDYATYKEYTRALARYEIRQELAAVESKQKQAKEQEEFRTREQVWQKKVEEGRKKYEDFDELFVDVEPPPAAIRDLITGPKVPVEVVHFLLTHPDKHKELNRMNPADAAFELADIKNQLAQQPKPTPKPTKAPAPMTPTRGSAAVVQSDDGYDIY